MIGDKLDVAETKLTEELSKVGKKEDYIFDMEPLFVLISLARDIKIRDIDGSLQIAKVNESGSIKLFGVKWPSSSGKHTFFSRELDHYLNPEIKCYDPDTCAIMEEDLPNNLSTLNSRLSIEINFINTEPGFDFINKCYPGDNLKKDISEIDKEKLVRIFKEYLYKEFLNSINNSEEARANE